MTRHPFAATLLMSAFLTGCGGGGGANTPAQASPATYSFVRPTLGAHLVFAQTLTDNLNNTINRTMTQDVTAVNADCRPDVEDQLRRNVRRRYGHCIELGRDLRRCRHDHHRSRHVHCGRRCGHVVRRVAV